MPTLHQLGITTPTREKLSGIKRSRPDSSPPTTNNPAFVPIKTPSALLSRDPHQLSKTLDVPIGNLKTIRAGVADALICDECIGHHSRCAEIVDCVDKFCVKSDFVSNNDNVNEGSGKFDALRPLQFIVGSISALELAAHSLHVGNTRYISTGSRALDSLLATQINVNLSLGHPFDISQQHNSSNNTINTTGGVPFGQITEVSSPPSSGKTQFCLSVAANAHQCRVFYITSGNVQSISRRLFTLCIERGRASGKDNVKQFAEREMNRVIISSVPDAYSLLAMLAKIEHRLCNNTNEMHSTLIVIDSISSIIGHHLSSLTTGAALLNQVGLTLRRMSRSLNNCSNGNGLQQFGIVIANGSVANWSDGENKPAMGRYWHVSDVGLWLEDENSHERLKMEDFYNNGSVGVCRQSKKVVRATLLNHWGKGCGESVQFVVRSGGVCDL